MDYATRMLLDTDSKLNGKSFDGCDFCRINIAPFIGAYNYWESKRAFFLCP